MCGTSAFGAAFGFGGGVDAAPAGAASATRSDPTTRLRMLIPSKSGEGCPARSAGNDDLIGRSALADEGALVCLGFMAAVTATRPGRVPAARFVFHIEALT